MKKCFICDDDGEIFIGDLFFCSKECIRNFKIVDAIYNLIECIEGVNNE